MRGGNSRKRVILALLEGTWRRAPSADLSYEDVLATDPGSIPCGQGICVLFLRLPDIERMRSARALWQSPCEVRGRLGPDTASDRTLPPVRTFDLGIAPRLRMALRPVQDGTTSGCEFTARAWRLLQLPVEGRTRHGVPAFSLRVGHGQARWGWVVFDVVPPMRIEVRISKPLFTPGKTTELDS
jgi:hypothetical protein